MVLKTFYLLFLHNSHGTKEIPNCGHLVRPDWVGNLRWDNTEPYEPFRWVNMEPSVQFRKANTDPSMQFRKANTDPSMQFRWSHTEFLFCQVLRKNLHESVKPLSHLQTSPGKSSWHDAWHKTLIVLITSLICSVYFAYNCQFTMPCYAMQCHVMSCHVLCNVPCAMQRHLAPETNSSARRRMLETLLTAEVQLIADTMA